MMRTLKKEKREVEIRMDNDDGEHWLIIVVNLIGIGSAKASSNFGTLVSYKTPKLS